MIHHFGTFDVSNYGDLLFPVVLEMRLRSLGVTHFSPIGGLPPLAGAVESQSSRAINKELSASLPLSAPAPSAVIVGGGHLIHASPSSVPAYRSSAELALQAYPSLWLGAAHLALAQDVPLIWNAPGIPAELGPKSSRLLSWATSFCDYLSVRDERSLRLLRLAGFEGDAHVVPDTGHDIARLFSAAEIDSAYHQAFSKRDRSPAERTLSFHLNERYLGEEPGLVARRVDQICTQADATPILIALGACHGDDALAREVGALMRTNPLILDQPESLLEAAACIARSHAYIGSSLHGAITACAFGRRAMLVASERDDGGKFSAFLGDHDLQAWLLPNWAKAEARSADFLDCDDAPWRAVQERVSPALDRHWQSVEAALRERRRHPGTRADAAIRFDALNRDAVSSTGIYAGLLTEQAALAVAQQDSIRAHKKHARKLKASYRAANRDLRLKIAALEQSKPNSGN